MVLVHLRTNRIQTLNRTAARLWELLEEGRSSSEIKQLLLTEFEVGEEELEAEMDRLLKALQESQLIVADDKG